MNANTFLIRITACFILSILIGIERQYRHRMVGLRTNVLVSLGSFMFMCMSFGLKTNDETRIAAQIVSGIGFLGAGVILRDGSKIKGLNTAATLWCVAAIGALTATGMLFEASVGTVFVLMSNIVLRLISKKIMEKFQTTQKEKCTIKISCKKEIEVVIRTTLSKIVAKNNLNLKSLERTEITKQEVKLQATIITTRTQIIEEIIHNISINPGVTSISWNHEKYIQTDNEDDIEEENDEIEVEE